LEGATGTPARFEPRHGDRFLIRAGKGQAFRIEVERK
jgi:hypothetical protein